MKWFNGKTHKQGVVGIEFNTKGIAFAHVQQDAATQSPRLQHAEFLPDEGNTANVERLHERLVASGLQGLPCRVVLNPDSYQLLLVEAPEVPANELTDALRWRIKDLINFPVADAVLDTFLLPESCSRGGHRMAYVTVVKHEVIAATVAWVKQSSLKLKSIDIAELALRNVAHTVSDTSRGLALVTISQGSGSLQLVRNGELYLARNFKLNYKGGLLDELPSEALLLELQRSLDYFERQMKQPPPTQIFLAGENISSDKITEVLSSGLPASVEIFPLLQGISLGDGVEEHLLPLCFLALGAALRAEEAA